MPPPHTHTLPEGKKKEKKKKIEKETKSEAKLPSLGANLAVSLVSHCH